MFTDFLLFLLLEKKIKVKLAPAIPTGAPTTLTKEIIQTKPLHALIFVYIMKTSNTLA